MLNQVADGVWVQQSEWVWTNSIVVRGEDGLILIDPGIGALPGVWARRLTPAFSCRGIPRKRRSWRRPA